MINILQSDYSLTEVRVMFEANTNPGITARKLKTELKIDEGIFESFGGEARKAENSPKESVAGR